MSKHRRRSRMKYPVLLRPGMVAYVYEDLGYLAICTETQHYFGYPPRRSGVPVTWNDLVDLLNAMALDQGLRAEETETRNVFEFQRRDQARTG
jgi:hypothetical protein